MVMKWSGRVLADLRTDADMPQRKLAEQVHLSSCMISAYEHDNKTPSVETVIAFAQIFGVSTDYLLGLTDLKTMPSFLKTEFANGQSYQDVLTMMEGLSPDERKVLLTIASYMKK